MEATALALVGNGQPIVCNTANTMWVLDEHQESLPSRQAILESEISILLRRSSLSDRRRISSLAYRNQHSPVQRSSWDGRTCRRHKKREKVVEMAGCVHVPAYFHAARGKSRHRAIRALDEVGSATMRPTFETPESTGVTLGRVDLKPERSQTSPSRMWNRY